MLLHLFTLLITIFAKFGGAIPNGPTEYLGISLGSLRNASLGISGHVWMANATAIQISDFSIEPHQKQELAFAFISEDGIELAKFIYKVVPQGNLGGEDGLIPIKRRLNSGIEAKRLVIIVPRGTIGDWKRFGLVAGKSRKQLAVVPLNKAGVSAPEPFCCIQQQQNGEQSEGRGIIGDHYAASTGPISVEDSRTLVLHKFSLEANKAPDAWIFAGKGEVRQSTGKKARVLGRDTPARHCSLREFYGGNSDLSVRLAPGQDIYQIDYISMFCYQYDVDFGHISFHLNSTVNPVPAYIPEVLAASVPSQEEEKQLELLESNDLEGIC